MDRRALLKAAAAGVALSSLTGAGARGKPTAPTPASGGGEIMALGWYVIFGRPSARISSSICRTTPWRNR
jgi:hypothetical protein